MRKLVVGKCAITRVGIVLSVLVTGVCGAFADDRPNILWITSEDNSAYLGCYGDKVARTPALDRLAESAFRYLNCFSNAAVCAPARQTLITGMYATSLGGQHMRSEVTFPEHVRLFPSYLRERGYYTSNNSKTDYNGGLADRAGSMRAAWDDSSNRAHWRNRPPGSPFFAVFNIGDTHESRLFPRAWNKRTLKTDPAAVQVPAYLPDVPEVRRDIARYYDCLETMDAKVGRLLAELAEDGLTETTIVFYFSDHGGSLPRGKSFTYDSGTRVPLLVSIPQKWAAWRPAANGTALDRLVSFVDFAPTLLSLAGIRAPDHMQGRAFLGPLAGEPRAYVHTFRGRRGERYDIVRGVRTKHYLYLRNYTPHLPVMQFNGYSFAIPSYLVWMDAVRRGHASPEQARWFSAKSAEELYAVRDDPDMVRNLADDAKHAEVLTRHRAAHRQHVLAVRDSVFFAEGLQGRAFARFQDEQAYPLLQLLPLAAQVSAGKERSLNGFREAMRSENPCVRYWGVMGCIVLGPKADAARRDLQHLQADQEPVIRIQAARALVGIGAMADAVPTVRALLRHEDEIIRLRAALVVDEGQLLPTYPDLATALKEVRGAYAKRVVDRILDPGS